MVTIGVFLQVLIIAGSRYADEKAPRPADIYEATVVNVADCDTYDVERRWVERIRLSNADTWESRLVRRAGATVDDIKAEIAKGKAAAQAAEKKLLGQRVTVEIRPPGARDNFGRALGRVWHEDQDVGVWLEKNGHTRQP
jgi:hypothetical protein